MNSLSYTQNREKLSVTSSAMKKTKKKQKNNRITVHLDRLPEPSEEHPGMERSVLSLSGPDQVGLTYTASTYLLKHGANVESCYGRRLDHLGRVYGAHLLFEASPESMHNINERGIRKACINLEGSPEEQQTTLKRYQLTVMAPDRKGILATVAETLLKRNIGIVSNDTVTFRTPLPTELGGSGDMIKICTLNMLLAIQNREHDDKLEDLNDGLEYLEHRYHWYIQLERFQTRREKKEDPIIHLLEKGTRPQWN